MPTVREVMTTELVSVQPATLVMDAAHAMFSGGAGSALVMDGGKVIGIFTERDIMQALAVQPDAGRSSRVAQWMTSDPATIGPDSAVGEALDRMLAGHFRHLPVVEDEAVVGIVSMRDLARSIAKK
ncbi:MAG: CBS domain-containing protein [Actinomycetota bacterium]|nr:CBS domain-containing protein [Actinomycetota bacterium]